MVAFHSSLPYPHLNEVVVMAASSQKTAGRVSDHRAAAALVLEATVVVPKGLDPYLGEVMKASSHRAAAASHVARDLYPLQRDLLTAVPLLPNAVARRIRIPIAPDP